MNIRFDQHWHYFRPKGTFPSSYISSDDWVSDRRIAKIGKKYKNKIDLVLHFKKEIICWHYHSMRSNELHLDYQHVSYMAQSPWSQLDHSSETNAGRTHKEPTSNGRTEQEKMQSKTLHGMYHQHKVIDNEKSYHCLKKAGLKDSINPLIIGAHTKVHPLKHRPVIKDKEASLYKRYWSLAQSE